LQNVSFSSSYDCRGALCKLDISKTIPLFSYAQFTLYHLFGYAYGKSTFVLWKMAGAADMAVVPAVHLALKVGCSGGTWGYRRGELRAFYVILYEKTSISFS